jgi:hypothetical protein
MAGCIETRRSAFYRYATRLPGEPPLGLRDFAFSVGIYDDVVAS